MLIWREGEDYLLQLPRLLCEPIRKKLGMYVLRAKVKITDAGDEIVTLGLSGANAREILRTQFGELPQQPFGVIGTTQGSVIKISDSRFLVSTPAPNAASLWTALGQRAQPVGSSCWDWLNIRSGIPVILPQTQEQFVAQMVNLELLGGVNFNKGCYPGQEIVARMQYLGKLKRRMYLAHLSGSGAPQAGDELFRRRDGRPDLRHDRQRGARARRRLRRIGNGADIHPRNAGSALEIPAWRDFGIFAFALSAARCLSTAFGQAINSG